MAWILDTVVESSTLIVHSIAPFVKVLILALPLGIVTNKITVLTAGISVGIVTEL
jgi:hypothetical protein